MADLGARDEHERLVGRPFIDTIWRDKRVRAVGSQIVMRPPTETKHEFFVHVLANTLGADWKKAQDERPPEARHPILEWVEAWDDMRRVGGVTMPDRREEGPGVLARPGPAI